MPFTPTRRAALGLAAAFASLPLAISPAGATELTETDLGWRPHAFTLRSGETVAAEQGRLIVPARRDGATRATLTLGFVRLPSTSSTPGPPIIYLAGGPGGSALDAARGTRWPLFSALQSRGDVILLDQRGVGLSSAPPPCQTPWIFPTDQESTEALVNASLERTAATCAAQWSEQGVNLNAYNTAENTADVADLANALGGRVQLVSISYGVFLALAVLRDNAALIDRVVMAGTEGPDDTLKIPTRFDEALTEISRRAASDTTAAAHTPDLERSLRTVLARLEEGPVWGEANLPDGAKVPVLISSHDVRSLIAYNLGTSPDIVRIPQLVGSMERGDTGPMALGVMFLRSRLRNLSPMALSMDAASGASAERRAVVADAAARSLFGNTPNQPTADFASALGITPLADRWRSPVASDVPALFISGTLDPRTPPANAEAVRRGFPSSGHLLLDGAAHDNDLFLSSPVILERILAFLGGEPARDERVVVDVLRYR